MFSMTVGTRPCARKRPCSVLRYPTDTLIAVDILPETLLWDEDAEYPQRTPATSCSPRI